MSYAEHLVAVVTEDRDRVALVQHSFEPIASTCVVQVKEAMDVLQLAPVAADAFTEERPVPHLIVLDHWPSPPSIDALRRIRAADELADVRIVVLCRAAAGAKDVARAYRLGASSCLAISEDADEFIATMEETARYWLLLNRWPTW